MTRLELVVIVVIAGSLWAAWDFDNSAARFSAASDEGLSTTASGATEDRFKVRVTEAGPDTDGRSKPSRRSALGAGTPLTQPEVAMRVSLKGNADLPHPGGTGGARQRDDAHPQLETSVQPRDGQFAPVEPVSALDAFFRGKNGDPVPLDAIQFFEGIDAEDTAALFAR